MPNTKSAERRMRNSSKKHLHNNSISTRLHTLEKSFQSTVTAGKKEEASAALRLTTSAWDKAAKTGVVPKSRADRKKSRLALQLSKMK